MHPLSFDCSSIKFRDVWMPSPQELEKVAEVVLGTATEGWLRPENHVMVIASRHLAASSESLVEELSTLGQITRKVLEDGHSVSGLRAAAYFHLRFENIHPLRDGNGRIGRSIVAKQCEQVTGQRAQGILEAIYAHENDYKMVFVSDDQLIRYELLVDLLARITGIEPPAEVPPLTYSLSPLYPSKPRAGRLAGVATAKAKPGRNAPCPCGSGEKFKRCCESNWPVVRGRSIGVREIDPKGSRLNGAKIS